LRFVDDDSLDATVGCSGCGAQLRVPRKEITPTVASTPAANSQNIPPAFSPQSSNPFAEDAPRYGQSGIDSQNPYQAPSLTSVATPTGSLKFVGRDPRLASRWKRFAGSILDSVFLVWPFIAFGIAEEVPDLEDVLVGFGIIAFCVMIIIHAVLVSMRGQSLAKLLLGMQIVKEPYDELPGFVNGILLRAILPGFISQLPFVGPFFNLADALFIFGDERQCLHDKMAKTKVLDVNLMRTYAERFADERGGRRVVYP
jgi:uncharacterized RDD family membrane protein YckC